MKILICCPSNGGCNEIVRRLIDVFGRKATETDTDHTTPQCKTIKIMINNHVFLFI